MRVLKGKEMKRGYRIELEQIGNIEVTITNRARRLIMRMGADGVVRVTSPVGVSEAYVREFVEKNAGYIEKRRQEVQNSGKSGEMLFTPETEFRTRTLKLRLLATAKDGRVRATIGKEWVSVTYPEGKDVAEPSFQEFVRKAIGAAYKREAAEYLPGRLAMWAERLGLKYKYVDIRDMRSRWGSCSTTGRICLNSQLMRLPDRLIDLVVVHELTHTIHPDHSAAFYADLDRFLEGRHSALRAELKKHGTMVTPASTYQEDA